MEEFDDIPTLEISLHWPHDRFAFGWDILQADEKYDYATINQKDVDYMVKQIKLRRNGATKKINRPS